VAICCGTSPAGHLEPIAPQQLWQHTHISFIDKLNGGSMLQPTGFFSKRNQLTLCSRTLLRCAGSALTCVLLSVQRAGLFTCQHAGATPHGMSILPAMLHNSGTWCPKVCKGRAGRQMVRSGEDRRFSLVLGEPPTAHRKHQQDALRRS
jgi:hypothetical protein